MKKPMRKTKRFNGADGSTVDDETRAKAMEYAKSAVQDETGTSFGTIRRNTETGELYDTAPKASAPKKAAPKAAPVKTESKAEVKAEVKPEPDNSAYAKKMKEAKNQAPLSRFTSNLGSPYPVDKPKEAPAVKTESKPSYAEKMEAGRNQTSLGKSIRSFFSGKPYGAEKYEREERMKKDLGDGMKAGGKVKSASARADGCAIRGKTRA
jgi:hypothetical protein